MSRADQQDQEAQDQKNGAAGADASPPRGHSRAEWISLGIGLAIILALVALVTYDQFSGGNHPPRLRVEHHTTDIRRDADAYYLPIEVTNQGGQAARDVRVRVSLDVVGGERDVAELLFDYVTGGATAHGTAILRQDPARSGLTVSVVSYVEP